LPRLRPVLLLTFALFAACQGAPDARPPRACTLALLKTGPRTEPLVGDERSKVFAGHFANMLRLAQEGHLLLAGPYGQQKSDQTLRGLFVLDTADRAQARALAETDPGFQAGVFRFEYHDLTTSAALQSCIQEELATRAEAEKQGKTPKPGEGGRTYVLLTAANGAMAEAALAGNPAVLMQGRLDGGGAFVLLDSKDLAAAQVVLAPCATKLGEHVLDEWFGSGLLATLPQRKA
jgi:uncharacterized protein YciI